MPIEKSILIYDMLTDEDIKNLVEAHKAVFATREEMDMKFDAMYGKFSDLQTGVDAYAKKADTFMQELVMLSRKVDRLEGWIHRIAQKVGVQLEY